MQTRHFNREIYFKEQEYTTQKYVIPFIGEVNKDMNILEIGCGDGGNLKPFLDLGCRVVGVDLSAILIEQANKIFTNHKNKANLQIICEDIYNIDNFDVKFDIIIIRDTLEHIHNQERFLEYIKKFLHSKTKIFIAFPPWQSPFGGHQQMCKNKFISKLPYFHILPKFIYKFILKIFRENKVKISSLMEIKETRISIERFKRILKLTNYKINKEEYYFINPNYEIKFKLAPRKQLKVFSSIPYFKNYLTTAYYSVISIKS